MDLAIREFSNTIINYINGAPLPIEVKHLVVGDIYHKLDVAADGEIRRQIAERDKAEQAAREAVRKAEKMKIADPDIEGIMKSAEMVNGMIVEQLEQEEREKQHAEAMFSLMDGGDAG